MMYRWCLTAACFDRYALTSFNARLRNFAAVHIAYRVIPVIIIVWLVLPIQTLVLFNLRGGQCGILYDVGMSLYFSSYTIITGTILPVSIMIVCAILIRRNLALKRQRRRQLRNNEQNNNGHWERIRDRQVFAMLLFQTLVFVVTQTPWMILFFYTAVTISIINKSANRVAIEQFIDFIANMILLLFPALSFCLYTLASRTFRDELLKLLRCPVRRRRRIITNRINPLPNDVPVRIST